MALLFGQSPLASSGRPGRILATGIDVHIDTILNVSRARTRSRTTVALENGESLNAHRIRDLETMTIEIVASNVEPVLGSLIEGRWERDHAEKTRKRLEEAQAFDGELRVWTGRAYERTPAGVDVWVLDSIDTTEEPVDRGVLRATLTFGESPRAQTQFSSAIDDVAEDLEDVSGDVADRGRQSTTDAGEDAAELAAGEVWP